MPLVRLPRRGRLAFGVVYASALVASWLTAATTRSEIALEKDERALALTTVGGARRAAVRVVFRDLPGAGSPGVEPVLMLHGSPGRSDDFRTIAPLVERGRRVIAPDLPGFGKSEADIPDYSIRAHAVYMLELLDRLGVERAHIVGYSMGGGVGLEMAAQAPARVASLVLLASIGLQEFELTGLYWPNRAIHAAQLGGLWLAQRAIPHFGLFEGSPLSIGYARNFFDSDQRPLRAALDGLEMPVLILHGRDDPLVPFEAAVEHHRRVPQSTLMEIPHGHFAPFVDGPALGARIAGFLADVEGGRAPAKPHADPARVAEARRPVRVPIRPRGFGLVVTIACVLASVVVPLAAWWGWRRRERKGVRGSRKSEVGSPK